MDVGMIAPNYISKYLIERPQVDLKAPRRGVLQARPSDTFNSATIKN